MIFVTELLYIFAASIDLYVISTKFFSKSVWKALACPSSSQVRHLSPIDIKLMLGSDAKWCSYLWNLLSLLGKYP